jgi:hypothetical protein
MYSGFGFSNLLYSIQQEWFVFVLVFLIAFAMTYIALSRFFLGIDKVGIEDLLRGKKDKSVVKNKGMLVIISVSVGLLVAVGMTQTTWVGGYFGVNIGSGLTWLLTGISFIFPILILFAFIFALFKPLSRGVGRLWTVELSVLAVWGFIKYASVSDLIYSVPYSLQELVVTLSHAGALLLGLVVGAIIAKAAKTSNSN